MLGKRPSLRGAGGVDLERLRLESIKQDFPVTDELLDKLLVPAKYRDEIKGSWKTSPELNLEFPFYESRQGFVTLFVGYGDEQLDAGLILEDSTDEDAEPQEIWASEAPEWTEDQKKMLESAWEPFDPVKPLKAEPRTSPNAKCPCNSGKKFKKCCGKFS